MNHKKKANGLETMKCGNSKFIIFRPFHTSTKSKNTMKRRSTVEVSIFGLQHITNNWGALGLVNKELYMWKK
jgi:hypothetical protein